MDSLIERLRAALAPEYQVERELGSGGMGRVFLGHDVPLDRPVAIKVIRPELATAAAVGRFQREARILASIDHPNIVGVYRASEAAGLFYFVMEYLRGEPLSERLARDRLPVDEVVRIATDMLLALEAAHAHDVIHRDLKPSNIFLEGSRTVVVDFGLAKSAAQPSSTATAIGAGTPAYMPPEQATGGPVSPRTDVYAAGAVIYEAFSGMKWLARPSTQEADWSNVPPALVPVLARALAWSPNERWPDARSLREAVVAAAAAREPPESRKRRLAAVMFADMVGYTALMQQNEQAAREACAHIRVALEARGPAHNGQIIQYFGDGSLSIFASAVEALHAALEVQRSLQTATPVIHLRIGIHQGEIAYDEQGIYGDVVNVASRIQALAKAGGVLVSGKVHDEVQNQRAFHLQFLGRHRLKNVERPVRVYAVTAAAETGPESWIDPILNWLRTYRLRAATITAVAGAALIMPFTPVPEKIRNWLQCLWQDCPSSEYRIAVLPLMPAGGADSLLGHHIAQIAALNLDAVPGYPVVPFHRAADWWLHRQSDDPHDDLRAAHVLDGSISIEGTGIAVRAFIKQPGGRTTADIFFRAAAEPRALGDSLTMRVLGVLPPPKGVVPSLERLREVPWDALRPFLLGNDAFVRDDWETAEVLYRAATERHPTFGLAWWQLAIVQKWLPGRTPLDLVRLTENDTLTLTPADRALIRADAEPQGPPRIAALEAVRRDYPENAMADLLYGDELFHRGPFSGIGLDSAVNVLLYAADRDEHFSPPLEHALWALIRLGRADAAERTLNRLNAAAGRGRDTNPASYTGLMRLAFELRFRADAASSPASVLTVLSDTLRVFVTRVGLSFGLPETERALGASLFHTRGTRARVRGGGAVAQALALLALGRGRDAIAWLDSAAVLLGPDAELQAAQWRVFPRIFGWDVIPSDEVAKGRSRLAADWSDDARRARAHWLLAAEALASGQGARAAFWKARLRQADAEEGRVSEDESLVHFLDALEAAARGDYAQALALSEPLKLVGVMRPVPDPFFRAALHLSRGAWYERLDSLQAADREWLWSQNVDIAGWLDGAAEAAEIDWVFDAYSAYLRSTAAARAPTRDARVVCSHLAQLERYWGAADPPSAELLVRTRRGVRPCRQ